MIRIELQPVGEVEDGALDRLATALARVFTTSVRLRTKALDGAFAWDAARRQYYSTAILKKLTEINPGGNGRMLGVTGGDLFVPVLTFVFGEAQLEGRCALVSRHRLREEFYGLPADPGLAHERLVKEAVHELGHTFGLRHCDDWRCVMASSHGVELLDAKSAEFCRECRSNVLAGV